MLKLRNILSNASQIWCLIHWHFIFLIQIILNCSLFALLNAFLITMFNISIELCELNWGTFENTISGSEEHRTLFPGLGTCITETGSTVQTRNKQRRWWLCHRSVQIQWPWGFVQKKSVCPCEFVQWRNQIDCSLYGEINIKLQNESVSL